MGIKRLRDEASFITSALVEDMPPMIYGYTGKVIISNVRVEFKCSFLTGYVWNLVSVQVTGEWYSSEDDSSPRSNNIGVLYDVDLHGWLRKWVDEVCPSSTGLVMRK